MEDTKKTLPPKTTVNLYRKTEAVTATRETLLLMLYAGAIRFLKKGIEATEKNDVAEKGKFILKTQEIINELRATLNFEVGKEIAENLDRLYLFVTDRLLVGNSNNDIKSLQEALKVLETLNSAWEEAVAALKKSKEA